MFYNVIGKEEYRARKFPPINISFKREYASRRVSSNAPGPKFNFDGLTGRSLNQCIYSCLQFYCLYDPNQIAELGRRLAPKLEDQDIERATVHAGSKHWLLLTQAEILEGYLVRTKEKEDLNEILSCFHNQAYLQETVKNMQGCTPEEADNIIGATLLEASEHHGLSYYYPIFAFLAMHVNGIPCGEANGFISIVQDVIHGGNGGSDPTEAAEHYHMENGFLESRAVKKWLGELSLRLDRYAKDTFGSESAVQCLLAQFYGQSGDFASFAPGERAGLIFRAPYKYLSSCCCDLYADQGSKDMEKLAGEVVEDIILNHILSCFEEDYVIREQNRNAEPKEVQFPGIGSLHNPTEPDPDEGLTEWKANGLLRRTDIPSLFWACYSAMTARMIYDSAEDAIRYTAADQILGEGADVYQEEINRLKQENKHLQGQITDLKNRELTMAAIAKPSPTLKHDPSAREAELSSALKGCEGELAGLRKELREKDKEMEKLREMLEEAQADVEFLSARVQSIQAKEAPIKEADPEGRYFFIAYDDKMIGKLKQWFPNSVCSRGSDVNEFNAASYSLAVCFSNQIPHKEYYRMKNRCINFGIPFIHCNVCNYHAILEVIAEALEGA